MELFFPPFSVFRKTFNNNKKNMKDQGKSASGAKWPHPKKEKLCEMRHCSIPFLFLLKERKTWPKRVKKSVRKTFSPPPFNKSSKGDCCCDDNDERKASSIMVHISLKTSLSNLREEWIWRNRNCDWWNGLRVKSPSATLFLHCQRSPLVARSFRAKIPRTRGVSLLAFCASRTGWSGRSNHVIFASLSLAS